jgi:murein DD-endopeptidase MepM/ murein hydrolase activator NlpD
LQDLHADRLRQRRRPLFVERELTIRSGQQVRTLTLSNRKQLTVALGAVAGAAALAFSLGAMAMNQQETQEQLLAREARIEGEAARVASFRDDLDNVAQDLQRRQVFLEEMVELLPADITDEGDPADAGEPKVDGATRKLSAAFPEGAALAQLEQRQLSLAERLTRFAEARVAGAEAAIRKLGLDPRAVVAGARTAQGGPLERLAMDGHSAHDRPFRKLGISLARMDELESALARIPQVMPADGTMVSSSYGVRRDPFTGEAAMHSGLDFRGAAGAPIHAAAEGRVSFVGVKGGYGNVIEVSHGNGLMTRYAHMSGFKARVGQEVAAGDVIGLIGSTGRSTGPHLHFEVRVNGRAVNPRPFLLTAPQLLQQARETEG